jgi:hypothetical protein
MVVKWLKPVAGLLHNDDVASLVIRSPCTIYHRVTGFRGIKVRSGLRTNC